MVLRLHEKKLQYKRVITVLNVTQSKKGQMRQNQTPEVLKLNTLYLFSKYSSWQWKSLLFTLPTKNQKSHFPW